MCINDLPSSGTCKPILYHPINKSNLFAFALRNLHNQSNALVLSIE